MFGFFKKLKEKRRRRFEGVYAGPEIVKSGDGNTEFNEVYAGPDAFGKPDDGGDDRQFARVYAGPRVPNVNEQVDRPDTQQFMCVYAGPEMMRGEIPTAGMFVGEPGQNGETPGKPDDGAGEGEPEEPEE